MKEYYRELNKCLDEMFGAWQGTATALAQASDLHVSTVHNLNVRNTKYPRFSTVWKLARATGFTVRVVKIRQMRQAG